jgi:hypothetical protein
MDGLKHFLSKALKIYMPYSIVFRYLSKEEKHETELKRMTVDHLQKLLFTTSKSDDKLHRCVVVFDKKYAVSSQHGDHSSFKKGDKIFLYNVMDSNLEIEVCLTF